MDKHNEKMLNALLVQAFSDAIGDPFEFKKKPTAKQVLDYAKNKKAIKTITDDTQMTLFGFEAIKHIIDDGGEYLVKENFEQEYANWWLTQTNKPFHPGINHPLLKEKMMFSVKAPGITCMKSCYEIYHHGQALENDSYGCGSVMRLLPICELFSRSDDLSQIKRIAALSCLTTHKHPQNTQASDTLIDAFYKIYHEQPIENVKADKISEIGEGWSAQECVDMAIWAYNTSSSFSEMLVKAICHSGDSDSVAAVSGALWGMSMKPLDLEIGFLEKEFIQEYYLEYFSDTI